MTSPTISTRKDGGLNIEQAGILVADVDPLSAFLLAVSILQAHAQVAMSRVQGELSPSPVAEPGKIIRL